MFDQTEKEAIGGYLELDLPSGVGTLNERALLYQSGRAAFRALLQTVRPSRVFVPRLICNSMISPLQEERIEYLWYDLDDQLMPREKVVLEEGEIMLYVNYFGVCQNQVKEILENFRPEQVVFDFSQSLFERPVTEALATIYSPRKFLGVPDGGMLVTSSEVDPPIEVDDGSLGRMTHLLKRLYSTPEEGYYDYVQAEKGLEDSTPRRMSGLTRRLLDSIDINSIREKRLVNFSHLEERLGPRNRFRADDSQSESPLCYPLAVDVPGLREHLLAHRIFVPTYWRDSEERVESAFGKKMIDGLLPLPVDQRYGEKDMDALVSLIDEFLE
ncbi:hypothetical protein SAMN05660831_02631 [Thiohalospira halophila DSM 15071]|uniref:dTDP-4-amino-4,6-dideoxygalactose transaminase n=1 Tax=Thiohalospira halophila DSM 15071 TaxID=1123397 RepID=A0A1I1WDC0_9GAMM|nr:hypothetical protein [Thiohalospira halophila]SFD93072.1 hypothetical protein SAMN05660831_02631 [Thiohalospira halophila DSM 15071]